VRDGVLTAVIDFGTSGVGDPACDLVIAWTFFAGPAGRCSGGGRAGRRRVGPGSGWALWKSMITLADGSAVDINHRIIDAVLDD